MANCIKVPMTVKELGDILKDAGDKLVVVDFTATWCGPCKMIAPRFKEQCEKPENKNVVFVKVDVDDVDDVSSEYGVTCMPTFHFYQNEIKVDEFAGANLDTLILKLEKYRT